MNSDSPCKVASPSRHTSQTLTARAPPKRVHRSGTRSGTRSVPARASVATSPWFSSIPLAFEIPLASSAILLHDVGPLPFDATRPDASQKQGLAAQQVPASFHSRGCADSYGRQFPRHTSCTQLAGRRPQEKAISAQPTRTFTALAAVSLSHQSL